MKGPTSGRVPRDYPSGRAVLWSPCVRPNWHFEVSCHRTHLSFSSLPTFRTTLLESPLTPRLLFARLPCKKVYRDPRRPTSDHTLGPALLSVEWVSGEGRIPVVRASQEPNTRVTRRKGRQWYRVQHNPKTGGGGDGRGLTSEKNILFYN